MRSYLNTIVTIFFAGAILISCDQTTSKSEEKPLAEGIPEGAETEAYPGNPDLLKVTLRNGENISEQGDYWKGVKHGAWTTYHPNGLVKTVTSYVNGKKQGIHLEIDNRGDLTQKLNYFNDQLHGEFVRYEYSKVKEERFYLNNLLEGTLKKYYSNGKVQEESNFENGKREGVSRWYDQEGNLTIEYEYRDNERVVE